METSLLTFLGFQLDVINWIVIFPSYVSNTTTDNYSLPVLGPWSIHRGTPRTRPKCILKCSGDAPSGASSGIQILPSSFERARTLTGFIMDRSARWLGIPRVSFYRTSSNRVRTINLPKKNPYIFSMNPTLKIQPIPPNAKARQEIKYESNGICQ